MHAHTIRKDTEQRQRLAELVRGVEAMELDELHSLWKHVFGHRSFTRSKVYLRRMLAYRFDELRKNGNGAQVRAAIQSLAARERWQIRKRSAAKLAIGKFSVRDARLPPAGTVLRKDFGGRVHEVLIEDNHFRYEGISYRSLSTVAVRIYGGNVNGFAFFSRALLEHNPTMVRLITGKNGRLLRSRRRAKPSAALGRHRAHVSQRAAGDLREVLAVLRQSGNNCSA